MPCKDLDFILQKMGTTKKKGFFLQFKIAVVNAASNPPLLKQLRIQIFHTLLPPKIENVKNVIARLTTAFAVC